MIDLGGTDLYINVPSLPRKEFEHYSTNLFDEWESYIGKVLKVPDYALVLEIEEGSIKVNAKVAACLYAIYIGIGQYGSFMAGSQTIQSQISAASDYLANHAVAPFTSRQTKPKIKKHSGSLGQLNRLFLKVQQGKITAQQAMIEAEAIFGEDLRSEPDFTSELRTSFENAPILAKQLNLPLSGVESEIFKKVINKKPRIPKPTPEQPIGQQFRVMVWRESKDKKRKVRVIEL
ncbi:MULTISPECIES: hypothetical protein [Stutzerimonas stutzeri subgroup]|uniref:hypothetical protein n=1 Tax=Stutzerimonas stutzeri subgroup TaxID=578833 RepID=UPI000A06DE9E|nr:MULTISPECIES: hypothetical protein [Stutzerimonas stutzeri subgroup]